MIELKKCSKCKENKPYSDFYTHRKNKDGYGYQCKNCIRVKDQEKYNKNKTKILEKQKEYREKNLESLQQYSLNYYHTNKISMGLYHKEYIEKTKEKRNEYWRKYQKQRWENDKEYKVSKLLRKHIYLFLTNQKTKKTIQTESILGYSYQEFIKNIGSPKNGEHIDHKIPITWFKKDTPPDIIWNLHNLQIVDSLYNWSKKNRFFDMVNDKYLIQIKNHIEEKYLPILYPNLDI
jgi:hypothetical protein